MAIFFHSARALAPGEPLLTIGCAVVLPYTPDLCDYVSRVADSLSIRTYYAETNPLAGAMAWEMAPADMERLLIEIAPGASA
jgi:hypothetical protein